MATKLKQCLYCETPVREGKTSCYFHIGSTGTKHDHARATQHTRRRVREAQESKVRIKKRNAKQSDQEEYT